MSATDQPIRSVKAITPGTALSPGRLFIINCTVAGNVEITLFDSSVHIVAAAVGYAAYPYAVRNVTSGGNTTATATYANGY